MLGFERSQRFHAARPLRTGSGIVESERITNETTDGTAALVTVLLQHFQQGRFRTAEGAQNLMLCIHIGIV